ncbi:ATP-binding cassette domain-containing protein [Actinoplanes sp. URMC 104]|uniref:ATP-binding cassette domain-containing protein n=1 Tax=Actinoplanes sp. URMC 104 TaxID=3423409 RepID=UPI003F19A38B
MELRGAGVVRDGRRILAGVDLVLEPGTVTVVAGASGSGRTTLLDLAAGLAPTEGVVRFDGADVRTLDGDDIAASVAVVTRRPFIAGAPVRQNLALGAGHDDAALWEALRLVGADDDVRDLPHGLDTVLDAPVPDALRQQIGLARAVLRRPRLLVLDDATSALSADAERRVLAGLPTTTLAATDRPAAADRVVLLSGGRLTAAAPQDRQAYAVVP